MYILLIYIHVLCDMYIRKTPLLRHIYTYIFMSHSTCIYINNNTILKKDACLEAYIYMHYIQCIIIDIYT